MRWFWLSVLPFLWACGSDASLAITRLFVFDATTNAAPPGLGPDRRVVVATRGSTGRLWTLEEGNGRVLEGGNEGYETFPTEHAPNFLGTDLFLVTSIGQLKRLNLAGQSLPANNLQMGRTTGIAKAPDNTLRIAATAGQLHAFDAQGELQFSAPLTGAPDSLPAVAPDGTCYVATDAGQLLGFAPDGTPGFTQTVRAPASGPSIFGDRIAVGEIDGVSVFQNDGSLVFRHERDARVIGTRFMPSGALLAWGEDGIVERIATDGTVQMQFVAGPPIYADVFAVGEQLAVIDNDGRAYAIDENGQTIDTIDLQGQPSRRAVQGPSGLIYITVNGQVVGLDFASER